LSATAIFDSSATAPITTKLMINIAILASGGGSNAQKIMEYFVGHSTIKVSLVVSNRAEAGVIVVAHRYGVDTLLISAKQIRNSDILLEKIKSKHIEYIVLAGFLVLIPKYLIDAYPNKIINIHPALLPKFGGKGMHGHFVHEAVKAAGETQSGITIHYANEHYDEGDYIFQAKCPIHKSDTAEDIARKVLVLEHQYFASTLEMIINE
jgi:phosphoribosylglycinamide formyltransferase 1